MSEEEEAKTTPSEEVSSPELESFDGKELSNKNNPNDISMLLDIPVNISVEVGSALVSIDKLLKTGKGDVIELNRSAGDPLDIFVNGTLIAHGEVVTINNKFAIRFTEIVNKNSIVDSLGEHDE